MRVPVSDLIKNIILYGDNPVKTLRKVSGLSQHSLAEKLCLSGIDLDRIEHSKLDLITPELSSIASYFGLDSDLLLDASSIIAKPDLQSLDIVFNQHGQNINLTLLKKQILCWSVIILHHARKDWEELRRYSIKSLYLSDKKNEAVKRAQARDAKYAPFRQQFKKIQLDKFLEFHKSGKKLKANYFVSWFLRNSNLRFQIPYVKSNYLNKLIQLAQQNNREFKKRYGLN